MTALEYEKIITKEPVFIRENLIGDTSEVTCLSPEFIGKIYLSETMLNKGIIDANASVKKLFQKAKKRETYVKNLTRWNVFSIILRLLVVSLYIKPSVGIVGFQFLELNKKPLLVMF
jgi:hypothetical protein